MMKAQLEDQNKIRDIQAPSVREIVQCRICGNEDLVTVVDLGVQSLTGIFPSDRAKRITSGPLQLVKCREDAADSTCGLLQLKHSFNSHEMYGQNYGYRSGLNQSMVKHLQQKVQNILKIVPLDRGDIILDIGSNDGTLLKSYPSEGLSFVGIDPTAAKFKKYYPPYIQIIPDFFSAKRFVESFPQRNAKVVTSISMFYDLEDPILFMKNIYEILEDDGLWVFEQSYMPTMLKMNAYDTICHEHLEYYALEQIQWMIDRTGFKIVDVEFNAVNGGSFSVAVAKKSSDRFKECLGKIRTILGQERASRLHTLAPYRAFDRKIGEHRTELKALIKKLKREGKKVFGYGASTKGNVILQSCDITVKDIPCIADINEDKHGCFTPYTGIPIISEEEARVQKPDYFLVLPWHFREGILSRESNFLAAGGKIIFPLPNIEVVGS